MKRLMVLEVNRNLTLISGRGSRELIIEVRNRVPVWSGLARAWVVQRHTARDVIALAEPRRFEIVVTQGNPLAEAIGVLW